VDAVSDEPLTDEELDAVAARAKEHRGELIDGSSSEGGPRWIDNPLAQDVVRLVAEVRRLRSDEWLERAVKEIVARRIPAAKGDNAGEYEAMVGEILLTILKKHRASP